MPEYAGGSRFREARQGPISTVNSCCSPITVSTSDEDEDEDEITDNIPTNTSDTSSKVFSSLPPNSENTIPSRAESSPESYASRKVVANQLRENRMLCREKDKLKAELLEERATSAKREAQLLKKLNKYEAEENQSEDEGEGTSDDEAEDEAKEDEGTEGNGGEAVSGIKSEGDGHQNGGEGNGEGEGQGGGSEEESVDW
jgi:hypothetical protein